MRCAPLVLAVLVLASPRLAGAEDVPTLHLVQGHSQVLDLPGIRQVAVGRSSVADVQVITGGRQLLVTGRAPGITTLDVWTRHGRRRWLIRVLAEDPRLLLDDVRSLAAEIPGVRVRIVGGRVVLEGRLRRARDAARLTRLVELYPGVLDFVERSGVRFAPQVRIEVTLVEIDRRRIVEAGIRWPTELDTLVSLSLERAWLGGAVAGTIVGASRLAAGLRALADQGVARMLARPVLVTKDGAAAAFHVGGTLPVPVANGLGDVSVSWRPYGIRLAVTPRVDGERRFELHLAISSSELDYGNAVETRGGVIPALRQQETTTVVNLVEGETLILAQLLGAREADRGRGVAGLAALPILGALFRTRHREERRGEVYVLVTPSTLVPGRLPRETTLEPLRRYADAATRGGGR